jgi:hypothetical protein
LARFDTPEAAFVVPRGEGAFKAHIGEGMCCVWTNVQIQRTAYRSDGMTSLCGNFNVLNLT